MPSQLTRDPLSALYDEDFPRWATEQAELLRQHRFGELDLAHLIEEVEDLRKTERKAILNNARVIVEHLLKLAASTDPLPENGWRASVREHRRRLDGELTPILRRELNDELPRLFRLARQDAAAGLRDNGERKAASVLPAACPYPLDQILDPGFWPPA